MMRTARRQALIQASRSVHCFYRIRIAQSALYISTPDSRYLLSDIFELPKNNLAALSRNRKEERFRVLILRDHWARVEMGFTQPEM